MFWNRKTQVLPIRNRISCIYLKFLHAFFFSHLHMPTTELNEWSLPLQAGSFLYTFGASTRTNNPQIQRHWKPEFLIRVDIIWLAAWWQDHFYLAGNSVKHSISDPYGWMWYEGTAKGDTLFSHTFYSTLHCHFFLARGFWFCFGFFTPILTPSLSFTWAKKSTTDEDDIPGKRSKPGWAFSNLDWGKELLAMTSRRECNDF